MNKKEDIIQMLKNNPIKIIKCGDIEIPVEYLKQTTVAVNGDDYIRVQQENQQLKDNWNKLKEIIKKKQDYYRHFKDNRYRKFLSELLDIMQEIEGSDSNE